MQIVSIYLVINLIGTLFPFLRGIIDLFHASPTRVLFRLYTAVLFSKANRVAHTHEPNYFDLSRVSLIHHETLFVFFLFSTHNAAANAIYLLLFRSDSVLLSSALHPNVFAISTKIFVQNRYDLKVLARGSNGLWCVN